MQATIPQAPKKISRTFPQFSLSRLLRTVFNPKAGERVCILIDLDKPRDVFDFKFLADPKWSIQRHAVKDFYEALRGGVLEELGLKNGDLFAYKITGGSNRELPDEAFAPDGRELSLSRDIYTNYDIVLCISTFSATAPLTAHAKHFGFRGATLHGVNDIILRSGLAVDYMEVSRVAEKLRLGMTRADSAEIDYEIDGRQFTLRLELGKQEAQKSHGLVRSGEPDVANLPAGEIYYVPVSAEGEFPMKYEDGTIGLCEVSGGRIRSVSLIRGDQKTIDEENAKHASDPATGELGELGFGTQELPPSGRDIQDEKILGTLHVATGRSDHLGGHLTPDKFAEPGKAQHDDILFSPTKTPEINVPQARLRWGDRVEVVIENYEPSAYLRGLIEG
jgi:hypothetical protein